MARHLHDRFSEAFDGALAPADRARFDAHLAGCARCRDGYAEYTQALEAVRALPAARMPVTVVVPAGAPSLEPHASGAAAASAGFGAVLRRWPMRRLVPAGAALVGAAAVVTVVVVAARGHGGTPATTTAGGLNGVPGAAAPAQGGADRSNALSACAAPLAVTGTSGATVPTGYANSVVVTDPGRPGQRLALATQARSYAAGSTVVVYARLLAQSGGLVPCVSLGGPGAAHALSSEKQATGTAAGLVAPAPAAAAPLATQTVDGVPLLVVTVPAGLPAGTTLDLVATVPGGQPAGSGPPIVATLQITVG